MDAAIDGSGLQSQFGRSLARPFLSVACGGDARNLVQDFGLEPEMKRRVVHSNVRHAVLL